MAMLNLFLIFFLLRLRLWYVFCKEGSEKAVPHGVAFEKSLDSIYVNKNNLNTGGFEK